MRTNTPALTPRLAGGYGPHGAAQEPLHALRRVLMACLLWEDTFYENGETAAQRMRVLVPQVAPEEAARLARQARHEMGLRHAPLWAAAIMATIPSHRQHLRRLLPDLIRRADEPGEVLAMYRRLHDGRRVPIPAAMKKGLAEALLRFDEYQMGKYARRGGAYRLGDVVKLVHPRPVDAAQAAMFRRLLAGDLEPPVTWEALLSRGGDPRQVWPMLLAEGKLGALALLRNLRNILAAGVSEQEVVAALDRASPNGVLPTQILAAAEAAPAEPVRAALERLLRRSLSAWPALTGTTIIVLDVSGSMTASLSLRSQMTRLDAAALVAWLAVQASDTAVVYATAGSDGSRMHCTERLSLDRQASPWETATQARDACQRLGMGGIFTRQALEHIAAEVPDDVGRILVITDSQDCDRPEAGPPRPFGRQNYIMDVSAHTFGIAYPGVWTAEISGFSPMVIAYIAERERQEG